MKRRDFLFACFVIIWLTGQVWGGGDMSKILVLTDGLVSEYAWGPANERWLGPAHYPVEFYAKGLLHYNNRFQKYLQPYKDIQVEILDLERIDGEIPLKGIDLLILDDVRAVVLKEHLHQIIDFVKKGHSLIINAGFYGFGGKKPDPEASLLVKERLSYKDIGLDSFLPVKQTKSPDYVIAKNPIPRIDKNFHLFKGIPRDGWKVFGYHEVEGKRGSKVLAWIEKTPLLSYSKLGKGNVYVYTGSDLEWCHSKLDYSPWLFENL